MLSVVREFLLRHGLGQVFHAPPNVRIMDVPDQALAWRKACSSQIEPR